jgi:hypothetical protein
MVGRTLIGTKGMGWELPLKRSFMFKPLYGYYRRDSAEPKEWGKSSKILAFGEGSAD